MRNTKDNNNNRIMKTWWLVWHDFETSLAALEFLALVTFCVKLKYSKKNEKNFCGWNVGLKLPVHKVQRILWMFFENLKIVSRLQT